MFKLEQIGGWHMFFTELSSGQSVAPYRTAADYDSRLARIDGFLVWLECIQARLREGQRTGVVLELPSDAHESRTERGRKTMSAKLTCPLSAMPR